MIRDPSDGSVRGTPSELITGGPLREPQKPAPAPTAPHNSGERLPSSDAANVGAGPVIDPTTSGLQTGSEKPENLARLEKAREWIRDYRAGKINQKVEGE